MFLAITRRSAYLGAGKSSVGRTIRSVTTTVPSSVPKSTITEVKPPQVVAPAGSTDTAACDACACDEKPNDMLGSVKPYDRHVVICVPPNSDAEWERDISDHADHFPYNLNTHIEAIMKASKPPKAPKSTTEAPAEPVVLEEPNAKKALKVRVTAMVLSATDVIPTSGAQILVYPDNLSFTLAPEQVASFADFVVQPLPLRESSALLQYVHTEPLFKKLVLVCVHGSRDKRCGRAGPQVISELERLLEQRTTDSAASVTTTSTSSSASAAVLSSDVVVRGSSHIGGHVYAGTMIVYPEGQWYGRITKHNSAELLSNILNGTVYTKCSRGSTSSNVLTW